MSPHGAMSTQYRHSFGNPSLLYSLLSLGGYMRHTIYYAPDKVDFEFHPQAKISDVLSFLLRG